MSQPCALAKCNRTSRGLCDCCQQNLCLQHLNEHNTSLVSQLNPITDEINALGDRLQSLNTEKAVGSCRRELEQWRTECHEKVDHVFQQKCQELDRLVDQKVKKQQTELLRLQSKVAELVREDETTRQDIDLLTSTIHRLKEQMDRIEHTCFGINTRSLVIDVSFIDVKERNELDLTTLSPVCKTIKRPVGSDRVISSNDRFLLIHQNPNLCFVDQELKIAKEVLWNHGDICDMCWSSTLNRFIVVGEKHIFLVDDETLRIDKVQTIEEQKWLSCTCSETFLFLSTKTFASYVMKFRLIPTIELVKKWNYPETCAVGEVIHSIVYNDGTLGVAIKNMTEKSLRLELRSSETLDCIWTLRFDTGYNQNTIVDCCLLTCDQWLVADNASNRLFHVTKDGKLKSTIPYDGTPYGANLFVNMLVVSRTGGLNFHKL